MNITVIDGNGGLLGAQIIKGLACHFDALDITAVGTNSAATTSMIKAGAKNAATGENSVIVACRKADIIVGPIGIVIADALLGEITPRMAAAVGSANATRILIPINKCENLVAGVPDLNTGALIEDAVLKIKKVIDRKGKV